MKVYKGKAHKKPRKFSVRTTRQTIKKSPYECIGGAWDGETLYLTDGNTLPFNVDGEVGMYKSNKSIGKTYWTPL